MEIESHMEWKYLVPFKGLIEYWNENSYSGLESPHVPFSIQMEEQVLRTYNVGCLFLSVMIGAVGVKEGLEALIK